MPASEPSPVIDFTALPPARPPRCRWRRRSLRRSAQVLAAACVVSSSMMVAGRSDATDAGLAPGPSEAPPAATFSQSAGESTTPADANWPGKPDVTAAGTTGEVPPTPAPDPSAATGGSASPSPSPLHDPRETSLLPLAQPLWTELTPAQQQALQPFADEWNTWPAAEKRSWVALSDRLPTVAPEKREKMKRRIAEWARLKPEERRMARDAYRLAKERSADTRASEWERYRSMTQEQRSVLREAGTTSNTAAGHPGAPSGLAKEAAQPLPREPRRPWHGYSPAPPATLSQ